MTPTPFKVHYIRRADGSRLLLKSPDAFERQAAIDEDALASAAGDEERAALQARIETCRNVIAPYQRLVERARAAKQLVERVLQVRAYTLEDIEEVQPECESIQGTQVRVNTPKYRRLMLQRCVSGWEPEEAEGRKCAPDLAQRLWEKIETLSEPTEDELFFTLASLPTSGTCAPASS